MTEQTTTLQRTLGSFRLWGSPLGPVISESILAGAGWSQADAGLYDRRAGHRAMYLRLIFAMTTAIPHAGGPFALRLPRLGPTGGFIAGFATPD